MTSKKDRPKIFIHTQSEVQFFSVLPLLQELSHLRYDTHVVLEKFEQDKELNKLAIDTANLIKTYGFNPIFIEDLNNRNVDIYISPYLGPVMATCNLKYEYGTLNIKPNLTYIPSAMEGFHGFLCQSTVTSCLLSAYGKTFPVDNLRLCGKNRKKYTSLKKRLLFAPTYNDQDSVEELRRVLEQLKKNYHIIIKKHHGTQYFEKNREKKNIFKELADECYGSDTNLADLIIKSDICLFGNSSAIAEAIYAEVPCAIFSKDLDYFRLGDLHTTQYELVEDKFIPYTNKPEEIDAVIKKALGEECRQRQKKLAEILFPKEYRTGVKGYLKVIDYFLNDKNAQDYIKLQNYKFSSTDNFEKMLKKSEKKNQQLISDNVEMKKIIKEYKTGKLYRIAKRLYNIEGKFRNVNKS